VPNEGPINPVDVSPARHSSEVDLINDQGIYEDFQHSVWVLSTWHRILPLVLTSMDIIQKGRWRPAKEEEDR
jgi:hypothetical protein